jgi:hypothetical protein
MGIDFSPSEAHWSYSGFHSFRKRLAKEIGINLDEMEGYILGETYSDKKSKSWKGIKDPIRYLLDHSDCDGHITPKRCKRVAQRIRKLVDGWGSDYDKTNALYLAEGMEQAAKENINFEFH